MVDEYQDTNPLQEAILLELFNYTKNILDFLKKSQ